MALASRCVAKRCGGGADTEFFCSCRSNLYVDLTPQLRLVRLACFYNIAQRDNYMVWVLNLGTMQSMNILAM